ncbi:uncharacterized protein LOC134710901 [Mytilus trossulus]|uniref:uncharacterized protein LOC134710901 n=1 Tax=Mytilus trossulus TaxID=6551 RepID=UPI003003EFD2
MDGVVLLVHQEDQENQDDLEELIGGLKLLLLGLLMEAVEENLVTPEAREGEEEEAVEVQELLVSPSIGLLGDRKRVTKKNFRAKREVQFFSLKYLVLPGQGGLNPRPPTYEASMLH